MLSILSILSHHPHTFGQVQRLRTASICFSLSIRPLMLQMCTPACRRKNHGGAIWGLQVGEFSRQKKWCVYMHIHMLMMCLHATFHLLRAKSFWAIAIDRGLYQFSAYDLAERPWRLWRYVPEASSLSNLKSNHQLNQPSITTSPSSISRPPDPRPVFDTRNERRLQATLVCNPLAVLHIEPCLTRSLDIDFAHYHYDYYCC